MPVIPGKVQDLIYAAVAELADAWDLKSHE